MMYNVATGKMLFAKTAKLIPQILKMKKKALFFQKPLSKVFKRVSGGFWELAEEEFHTKLNKHKDRFSVIQIPLPKPVAYMFQDELTREKTELLATIDHFVTSNPLLSEIGTELITMSLYELVQYRILWGKGILGSDMPDDAKEQLDISFKRLEILKQHLESHERIRSLLGQPMSCYDLMVFIFNRVMLAMYRHTWSVKITAGLGQPNPSS
jgi:hypothetical protein